MAWFTIACSVRVAITIKAITLRYVLIFSRTRSRSEILMKHRICRKSDEIFEKPSSSTTLPLPTSSTHNTPFLSAAGSLMLTITNCSIWYPCSKTLLDPKSAMSAWFLTWHCKHSPAYHKTGLVYLSQGLFPRPTRLGRDLFDSEWSRLRLSLDCTFVINFVICIMSGFDNIPLMATCEWYSVHWIPAPTLKPACLCLYSSPFATYPFFFPVSRLGSRADWVVYTKST